MVEKDQATIYPPTLLPPFACPQPFSNYRNEVMSKFTAPRYEWSFQSIPYTPRPDMMTINKLNIPANNITTIDPARMRDVDDFYKAVQLHRGQYKDHSGNVAPLAFFKADGYAYECAPGMTTTYFSKYPAYFLKYKSPPVLPLTYTRRMQTVNIPELSLSGIYSKSNCIAYKR